MDYSSTPLPPPANWPVYWFARLEVAVEQGDHRAAAVAQRELARLGVQVQYGRHAAANRKAVADAR